MKILYTMDIKLKLPDGQEVYNSSRPLPGHITFTGTFRHGIYYSILDKTSNQYQKLLQEIQELEGWKVLYKSEEDFDRWLEAEMKRKGKNISTISDTLRENCMQYYIGTHFGVEEEN